MRPAPSPLADGPGPGRSLRSTLAAQPYLKLFGSIAFMASFFVAYFLVLNFPVFPVTVMPVTGLDRVIGFWPQSLYLYLTLWAYILLGPALLGDRRQLGIYCVAAGTLCVIGMGIFFFLPTAIPRPDVDWVRYAGFGSLKALDRSGNACPSLHAAFAVYTALLLHRLLAHFGDRGGWRLLNAAWCVGILYSTLATKQHVAVDVYAGSVLGALGAWLFWRIAGLPKEALPVAGRGA